MGWIKLVCCESHKCREPLSIGKHYYDKILCDIVPMNVTYVLFGQPWKFDMGISYRGWLNQYVVQVGPDQFRITKLETNSCYHIGV